MFQKVKPAEENHNILRNVFLIASIFALFIFVVAFSVYYVSEHIGHGDTCNSFIPIPIIVILLASLSFFIGTLVYYILSSKFMIQRKETSNTIKATLSFLAPDERSIVKCLIKHAPQNQAGLAKNTQLSRVKVHRVLKKLQEKGVIERTGNGVDLKPELKELF